MLFQRIMETPIGTLRIEVKNDQLVKIEFLKSFLHIEHEDHPLLDKTELQLTEYFVGNRQQFNLPFSFEGTLFQQEVWTALQTIPYGESCSYQALAQKIQRDKAVRAVGQANRRNPLPIVIPCHRVVGKNGSMIGYAGPQIDKKEYLLSLEKTHCSLV